MPPRKDSKRLGIVKRGKKVFQTVDEHVKEHVEEPVDCGGSF